MKELTLQELKEIAFDTLKMFDAFCKKHNIKYFLAYGTLLGAIRYKKFIPWDDDVDVLVPREDYERLLQLFQDSEQYRLHAYERNNKFHFPFAKLCDMTTRKEDTLYPNKKVALGVEVDIFPLDHFDQNLEIAKQEARQIRSYMNRLGFTKLRCPQTKNPLSFVAWSAILAYDKLLGGEYFVKKIIKECKKEHQKNSDYVGAKAWCIYAERGIIPAEAFSQTIEVEFEGEKFPAPAGYDTYLTCLYGDYLPEPPKEKQKTHHFFKAYRL